MNKLFLTCFTIFFSLGVFAQFPSRSSQSGTQSETSLITFGLDEDHLSAFAKTQLAEIAGEALAADLYRVELFGHTDQQGDSDYNAGLAARRAASVSSALADLGVQEGNILVRSFGESRLLEKENSEQAFAKNRRVELVLHTETIRTEDRLFEVLAASRSYTDVIDHDQENQLVGHEGVRITVPAQAFMFADGRALPVGAKVEVVLEEATRPSSMMAHQLSTNGEGGRLSTGGMVRVTGRYQGQTLNLAKNKAIDVEIPTPEFDTEMRLYIGERRDDAGMNWDLDEGESIKESARIVDGKTKKKLKLSPNEIEMVEKIKANLAKRNKYLAMMKTERLDKYEAPTFPKFKALPKAFNPKHGIPKKPFIPEAPTRSVAKKGLFKKGPSQRKLDANFLADSIAYVQETKSRENKLSTFADQLSRFEIETPDRERAHQAKVDATIDFRVGQAQMYLVEQYTFSAAKTVLNWKEKFEKTGPDGKQKKEKKSSLKKLQRSSFVASRSHADADSVIIKALGPQAKSERFTLDTVGFDFAAFERNFHNERGLTAPMDSVRALQQRMQKLFSLLQAKRFKRANDKPDKFNDQIAASYSFQIRTPMPMWHNCDHLLPEGLFQMMVAKPVSVRTYLYAGQEKSLDYFLPGRRAAAVYLKPVALDVISFGIVDKTLKLATAKSTASRSQTDTVELAYRNATLVEIEEALVALDTGS